MSCVKPYELSTLVLYSSRINVGSWLNLNVINMLSMKLSSGKACSVTTALKNLFYSCMLALLPDI